MSRRLGLIIGVNHYQDTTFRPLQFAENDARALAQWLVNVKGGNWSPADVQLVQGGHVTKELIDSLVIQLCINMAGPNDTVLIYFAGHAFVDERGGEGYLAVANTHYQQPNTGIHLFSLARQAMMSSRATNILFMLDCFQTGQIWSMRRTSPYDVQPLLGPTLLQALQQQVNRIFFCSCRGSECAPEAGERNLGLLMYHTIVGMSGPAKDSTTGDVSLQQLYTYLSTTLGAQQRPQVFGQAPTPILLVGEPQQASPVLSSAIHASNATRADRPRTTTGQLMNQPAQYTSAVAQLSPQLQPTQQRTTSGQLHMSAIKQHRQEQCKLLLNQAQQMVQAQHYTEALQVVNQVLQIMPDDVAALTLKAQILGTLDHSQEALAVVSQLLQLNPQNPLAWSMQAVLLTNAGQHRAALAAIEQSLEIDANNPESYSVKMTIMSRIAMEQSKAGPSSETNAPYQRTQQKPTSFLLAILIQVMGLAIGILGTLLPAFSPYIPLWAASLLEALGLSLLCVNAIRGAYLHGRSRVILTFFVSLLAVAPIGFAYKFAYKSLITLIESHPRLLLPLFFLATWLVVAAAVPLLLAIGGLIASTGRRKRR